MGLARADQIPGTAYSGRAYYNTTKEDPIAVTLRGDKPSTELAATLVIPRAYIISADGYTQRQYSVLPPQIGTTRALVAYRLSTGRAYNHEWRAVPSTEVGKHAMRFDVAFVELHPRLIAPRADARRWPDYYSSRTEISFEKLRSFEVSPKIPVVLLYDPLWSEPFEMISCLRDGTAEAWCEYSFEVCPSLVAQAHFVDFRFNGGTAFARARVASITQTLRSWITSCVPR